MNYFGIDISKYKHDCFIITDLGEVINEGFSFQNDAEGFAKFQLELEFCKRGGVRIGFEATGNYGVNLKNFLDKIGFDYMEINPYLVKEFIKSKSLRKTKTDKLDAKAIAEYMLSNDYKTAQSSSYSMFALKQLTRFRSDLVKQRTRYLIALTNILDCIFPEFKPLFGNRFTITSLYILTHYPSPEAIANMNSRSYDILRRISRGRFSLDKFVRLKDLAKNTVGIYDKCYGIELETLLDLLAQLGSKTDEVEDEITKMIQYFNPPTLSIKGVGPLSAAVIVSEFGDFSRFDSPDKMLSFAGLEPGYFQSGASEHNGRMVKRGSPHLRNALITCARAVRLHNETFAVYFHKKISEGKQFNVAISHVAKKLVRVIYALETKGVSFNQDLSK